nr:MAG TPA: hypothetical protein [Caudoviricetes sp.]
MWHSGHILYRRHSSYVASTSCPLGHLNYIGVRKFL